MQSLRIVPFWLIAVLITTLGMSIVHSLMIQQGLIDLGIVIPPDLRLSTMGKDFVGLLPTLGGIVAIGFAIAFFIASKLSRFAHPLVQAIAYPLAGAVAIAAALMLMKLQFSMTPIAGARTTEGLGLMILTGAIGGLIFARLRKS